MKPLRALLLSSAIIVLFLAGCNRFFGTPPVPAPTEAPLSVESTEPPASEATAALSPVLPEGRRATVSEVLNIVEVKVFAEANFMPVQDGAVIGVGGQVRTGTGSRARVDLSEGAIVRLGADSVFTVEALTDSGGGPFMLVKLELGKLWASLTGGNLQVITPVGVASVRGSFAVFEYNPGNPDDPSDDVLILDCIEGECNVQNSAVDEQAGNLQRIVLGNGGQEVTRATLTGEDVQNFIAVNPDVANAVAATLTAAAPSALEATATSASPGQATAAPTIAAPASTPVPVLGKHILIGGETLFCIGRAYGVLPGAIAEANGLNANAVVHPGQVLIIPAVRWFNIPAGPVCPRQFNSPFPGLSPMAPTPTNTQPVGAPGPTLTPTNTVEPTPACQPPEFFDPLLNRCRLPNTIDQPATPSDSVAPSISNVSASPTLVGTPGPGCTVTFQADITDKSGVTSANVSWTVYDISGMPVGPGGAGMSLFSGNTWKAITGVSVPSYGSLNWAVSASDGAGNTSSQPGGTISAATSSCP
jgi:LysM repeat protein